MKRFFTFLMAILALLSISQAAKAADVTVYFQSPSDWTTPVHVYAYGDGGAKLSNWENAPSCSEFHTSTGVKLWKYSFDSKFNRVIFKSDTGNSQYPSGDGFLVKDNHVYTSDGDKGTLSEFEKTDPYTYTLIGGYDNGSWTSESYSFKYDGVSKYTYTFTAAQTGEFRFRVNTNYTSGAALCPNVDANTKRKELNSAFDAVAYNDQKDASGILMSDNYWFCNVTNGKKYTFTLTETYNPTDDSYTRKLSVVPEGAVVTKVIKLLNGSSELTGTNGKYTLDLSSATADATITLSIDGASYGLATAKTISDAGTTLGIAFTTDGKEALTLKAGLIYYLSVTEDGKMTVVAKEKGVADSNYYLVGNFFTEDGDKINVDKKYFRFINNKGDGKLTFDIPASLSIKAQVYGADGKCYGPVNGEKDCFEISKTKPTADDVSVNGNLVAGENYWNFTERGIEQTGIYTITITVDKAGTPTNWEVKYDNSKRMAYFLVDPTEDYDAVVHPAYAVVKEDHSCKNNFYGNIYLEAGKHCFVVGNITKNNDNSKPGNPLTTTPKLYLQGNGGLDPTKTVPDSERDKYTKVYPNRTPGFTYNETKSMVLEYNPSKGHDNVVTEPGNHGIGGEILKASAQITDNDNPITSVQIVGNGVVGSWKLEDAKNMTYNKKLDCWEYTFTTDKSESAGNKFRFIANGSWKYNWGEDSTEPSKQARTPYTDTTKPGLEASLKEPNELGFTKNGTERGGDGTYGDMIFNRPAGEWTIRLYIRTLETEEGNNYVARYAYTITGREHTGIPLTYRAGKFIRTYSNNVAMDIIDPNVKVYEAYKYTMPDKVDNIYSQGTLELRQLKYIPANMGVVLIGTVPDTEAGKYTDGAKLNFSISKRTEKSAEKDEEYVDVWTKAADYKEKDEKWNNFLVPTVEAINDLGNVIKDQNGKVTYRFYCLGNYYRTNYYQENHTGEDYIGFFRMTPDGISGANKAYLSLPTSEDLPGGNYGYIDYNGQFIGTGGATALAKMMLVFDDETSGVTEIKNVEVNKQNNDNAYYTLQGIKVLKPTKGIFIHNGKKIVIK